MASKSTSSATESFSVSKFRSLLETKEVGRANVAHKAVATSTMDEADAMIGEGCPSGSLVVADEQTKGRGRNNRAWQSASRKNLYVSLVLRPPSIQDVININFSAPLAVAMAAEEVGVKEAKVKWPNDVWVGARKLAGVLLNTTAMAVSGKAQLAVNLGIGVNINQDMSRTERGDVASGEATSIIMENGGHAVSREAFLAHLCSSLEKLMLLERDALMAVYHKFDLLLGNEIVVMPNKKEDPSSYYMAEAVQYSKEGYLIVRPYSAPGAAKPGSGQGQQLRTLSAEEVSIRPHKAMSSDAKTRRENIESEAAAGSIDGADDAKTRPPS
eukprot:jgi/Bigna1/74173/fgenesh1_pg.28_\